MLFRQVLFATVFVATTAAPTVSWDKAAQIADGSGPAPDGSMWNGVGNWDRFDWDSIRLSRSSAAANPAALVFLNGRATRVTFNDGDSFRMQDGPMKGVQARLAGFNTLESHGPVHWWGDWHPFELYINAKMATLNGRRGVWHCTTQGETDTYGRVLTHCPDLIIDQVRKGLAHVMRVDDTPSKPEYVRAQQQAIKERRGMWAKGVPDFVLTSLHSLHEGRPNPYNRMVSTRDGHSEKWRHQDNYGECAVVCSTEIRVDKNLVRAGAKKLRSHAEIGPLLAEYQNFHLEEFVSRYARLGELPEYCPEEARAAMLKFLAAEKKAGRLGKPRKEKGSCGLYVQFERRYGEDKATCLKDRGNFEW